MAEEKLLQFIPKNSLKLSATSQHPQLNQIIQINGDILHLTSQKIADIGMAFVDQNAQTLHILPFHLINELLSQLTQGTYNIIQLFPVFGCFDLEIFENLSFQRKTRLRPVTLPCYLDQNLRSNFYGASSDLTYPLYDNQHGFSEMLTAHQIRCGALGVLKHDLFHVLEAIRIECTRGFNGQEKKFYYMLKEMLTNPKFVAKDSEIYGLMYMLLDLEGLFPATKLYLLKDLENPEIDKSAVQDKFLELLLEIQKDPKLYKTTLLENSTIANKELSPINHTNLGLPSF